MSDDVVFAVERVRSEVSSLNTSITWMFWLAVLFGVGTNVDGTPAEDDAAIPLCSSLVTLGHVSAADQDYFMLSCMSSRGFEFTYKPPCSLWSGAFNATCYERRTTWWRSKRWIVRQWDAAKTFLTH